MHPAPRPATWKVLLAFAIIYFVWGSTFLAIRIGVREVPPFLLAGMRFLLAGGALYAWMRMKGTASPTRREWLSASLLAVLIFVLDYGLLFWAEKRVPSGIAAVMMATIPLFMTLSEILFLGTQKLTARLAFALLVGIAGVAVLMSHSLSFGEVPIATSGAFALVVAAMSWSVASALTRKLPLPASKPMSSGRRCCAEAGCSRLPPALSVSFADSIRKRFRAEPGWPSPIWWSPDRSLPLPLMYGLSITNRQPKSDQIHRMGERPAFRILLGR